MIALNARHESVFSLARPAGFHRLPSTIGPGFPGLPAGSAARTFDDGHYRDAMRVVSPRKYQVITYADAAERFGFADVLQGGDYDQPVRLYEGDLHVRGDLVAKYGPKQCADNVVVAGDLVVDGEFDWWDDDECNKFFLVTGDLRAGAVSLGGCVELIVRGDVTAAAGVTGVAIGDGPAHSHSRLVTTHLRARYVSLYGHIDAVVHGDLTAADGIVGQSYDDLGSLTVNGHTRAPFIIDITSFTTTLDGSAEVGRRECFTLPSDFDDELEEVLDTLLVPEVHGDGEETRDIWELINIRLATGEPVLRPEPPNPDPR